MFVLYELTTGRAHSQSSVSFTNPDTSKWGIKETSLTGVWNEANLDFDTIPKNKRMTTLAFIELFTDVELLGVLDAAKVSAQVELFVLKMKQAEFIDLNYQPTIDGINGLVSAGLITSVRAGVILNG